MKIFSFSKRLDDSNPYVNLHETATEAYEELLEHVRGQLAFRLDRVDGQINDELNGNIFSMNVAYGDADAINSILLDMEAKLKRLQTPIMQSAYSLSIINSLLEDVRKLQQHDI